MSIGNYFVDGNKLIFYLYLFQYICAIVQFFILFIVLYLL